MTHQRLKTLVLSSEDVNRIVAKQGLDQIMDLMIRRLESGILGLNRNSTEIPVRSGFNYQGPIPGLVEWMPVHEKGKEVVIKVVGYHPDNPEKFQIPTILSTISSYDTATGHLKGLADGVLLTALRTGAASAVASKYMASENSSILGLIGCGAQSITQLHALSRVFGLKEVMIFDVDYNAMDSFESRIETLGLDLQIRKADMESILSDSDILCTATSIEIDKGPLFKECSTKTHLHVNAVGSDFPGKTELPISFLDRSIVVPDFKEQAILEGECQQLEDSQIGPDLAELMNGDADLDDIREKCTTVFDSTGWSLEDQVAMNLFLELAGTFGIGKEMAIENISEDAKNPYRHFAKISRLTSLDVKALP